MPEKSRSLLMRIVMEQLRNGRYVSKGSIPGETHQVPRHNDAAMLVLTLLDCPDVRPFLPEYSGRSRTVSAISNESKIRLPRPEAMPCPAEYSTDPPVSPCLCIYPLHMGGVPLVTSTCRTALTAVSSVCYGFHSVLIYQTVSEMYPPD